MQVVVMETRNTFCVRVEVLKSLQVPLTGASMRLFVYLKLKFFATGKLAAHWPDDISSVLRLACLACAAHPLYRRQTLRLHAMIQRYGRYPFICF